MKDYKLYLGSKFIGTTKLENIYSPSKVAMGKINDFQLDSGYVFFKNYCKKNKLEIRLDDRDQNMIATGTLHNLKLLQPNGEELFGSSNQIIGSDKEGFEVSIEGIQETTFQEKFQSAT